MSFQYAYDDPGDDTNYKNYLAQYPASRNIVAKNLRIEPPQQATLEEMLNNVAQNRDVPLLKNTDNIYFPKQIDKYRIMSPTEILSGKVRDKDSIVMQQFSKLIGPGMKFNTQQNAWQGQFPLSIVQKQLNTVENQNQNLQRSRQLLQHKLSPNQINQHLPQMVKQILLASEQFKLAGIGPISKKSLPLYAGRYWNQHTRRIDLIPKQSSILLNPLSLKQKIRDLQARVLNKWNQYVRQTQKLINFQNQNYSQQSYAKQQKKRIQLGLTKGTNQQSLQSKANFVEKIKKLIIGTITSSLPSNSPYYFVIPPVIKLLQPLTFNDDAQSRTYFDVMFTTSPADAKAPSALFSQYIQKTIDTLEKYIKDGAVDQVVRFVRQQQLNDPSQARQMKRYITAVQSLNPKSLSRVANYILSAIKSSYPVKKMERKAMAQLLTSNQRVRQKINMFKYTQDQNPAILTAFSSALKKPNRDMQTALKAAAKKFNDEYVYKKKKQFFENNPEVDPYYKKTIKTYAYQHQPKQDNIDYFYNVMKNVNDKPPQNISLQRFMPPSLATKYAQQSKRVQELKAIIDKKQKDEKQKIAKQRQKADKQFSKQKIDKQIQKEIENEQGVARRSLMDRGTEFQKLSKNQLQNLILSNIGPNATQQQIQDLKNKYNAAVALRSGETSKNNNLNLGTDIQGQQMQGQ